VSDGYRFHPDAFEDFEEIRVYIADESPDAADRTMAESF